MHSQRSFSLFPRELLRNDIVIECWTQLAHLLAAGQARSAGSARTTGSSSMPHSPEGEPLGPLPLLALRRQRAKDVGGTTAHSTSYGATRSGSWATAHLGASIHLRCREGSGRIKLIFILHAKRGSALISKQIANFCARQRQKMALKQ